MSEPNEILEKERRQKRRERIATVVLAGIVSNPDWDEKVNGPYALSAVQIADELIRALNGRSGLRGYYNPRADDR